MQIGNGIGAMMGSGRIGMDAESAGTGFFAADGDVAFAEYRAGIALAAAAFMLRQGGAVVEALLDVLVGCYSNHIPLPSEP